MNETTSLLPPSESQYLAQYVCDELDKVVGDNRKEVIKQTAIDIVTDLIKEDKKLASDVRAELLMSYPKIVTDNDLPQVQ